MIIEVKDTERSIIIDTNDSNIPFEINNGNGETVAYGNCFDGVTWHALDVINPVWIYEIVCILVSVVHRQHYDKHVIINELIEYTSSNFEKGVFKK